LAARQQRREKRRLEALALPFGARVEGWRIKGKWAGADFEIRPYYAGKQRRLSSVVVCLPFEGYPFRVRRAGYGDKVLVHLSARFKDFETGDADFDKRFHVGVGGGREEWMRAYTGETGRLDAIEWFFANGYSSVHSDGGRLYATYGAPALAVSNPLEKEDCPVWNPGFMRETLIALEHTARLDRPVAYESWEEWGRRIASSGFRFEGAQAIALAVIAALLAWMGLLVFMSSKGSGPV
jgi:hypothetical protein